MLITEELQEKNMTIYQLAKLSGVPYATVNDLCHEKTKLTKCSAETVYKISQVLNISMEDLLAPYLAKRASFENFKSAICHRVKEEGDIDFIVGVLKRDDVRRYYKRRWYPESFFYYEIRKNPVLIELSLAYESTIVRSGLPGCIPGLSCV